MTLMRSLFCGVLTALAVTTGLTAQEPRDAVPPVKQKIEPIASATPVRVGVINKSPKLVKRVEPAYPAAALAAHVEGIVVVEARVDATGKVTDAKVLRSPRPASSFTPPGLLDQAAIDAVKQWTYEPFMFNGAAIPVVLAASVTFKLPAKPAKPKP